MHTTSLFNSGTNNLSNMPQTNSINYPFVSNLNECSSFLDKFPIQRKIPIKIILNDDEEVASIENNSETTEENSIHDLRRSINYYKSIFRKFKKLEF